MEIILVLILGAILWFLGKKIRQAVYGIMRMESDIVGRIAMGLSKHPQPPKKNPAPLEIIAAVPPPRGSKKTEKLSYQAQLRKEIDDLCS